MPKFQIRYALAGGFGGVENADWETIEAEDLEKATDEAYQGACGVYDSYDGLHGLRSISQIMEEDDCDETEAEQVWEDERESWLDYEARPYVEGSEDDDE